MAAARGLFYSHIHAGIGSALNCEKHPENTMAHPVRLAALALALVAATGAQAQNTAVRTERNMSLDLANQIAAGAVAA